MYVQHFGLKNRPFHATAKGSDVFVGPQTATAIADIKRALAASDSVVTVFGPAGTGKTTLVNRALETTGENRIVVRISRIRLNSDDVLDLLLSEVAVDDAPGGTIRKFMAFRHRLAALERSQTRVFVVAEDAQRLGTDTLAEIEALTAADAGESDGANLVLMGDEHLQDMLESPLLSRLRQRIRRRHPVAAFSVAELRGYLRHCFRLAGAEFETLFTADTPDLLHYLCGGTPRVANAIVESALCVAAAQNDERVSSALVAEIAEREYGLSAEGFEFTDELEAETPDIEPAPEPAEEKPVIAFVEEAAREDDLPPSDESIRNPLPDLEELAPQLTDVVETEAVIPELAPEPPSAEPIPVLEAEQIPELIPELSLDSDGATGESQGKVEDQPEWDRDPTFAELKPDLDALEQAMAIAQNDTAESEAEEVQPEVVAAPVNETDDIPEITLDHAILQPVSDTLIEDADDAGAPSSEDAELPDVRIAERGDKSSDAQIDKITAELARAKSIEEVDEKMAETLFGEELSLAASQIFASPGTPEPAKTDAVAVATAPVDQVTKTTRPAPPSPIAEANGANAIEVTLEATPDEGFDPLSASQRLKTVRALNANLHPSLRTPNESAANEPPARTPDSIEDQINISMTQTLRALDVPPPVSNVADEADDEPEEKTGKTGFFSRFKR